jgi:Bacterial regulatory proteins, gntR family
VEGAWLGLSRSPVRDALSRLEDEALVESRPQRCTRVTRREVRDMFGMLAGMHALATELAVPVLRRDDVARLDRENEAFALALRRRDAAAAHAADERFHQVFVAAAANRERRPRARPAHTAGAPPQAAVGRCPPGPPPDRPAPGDRVTRAHPRRRRRRVRGPRELADGRRAVRPGADREIRG